MNFHEANPIQAVQPFEADPSAVYSLEAAAHLAQVPRHTILVCCKHHLISPVVDPERPGFFFNDEAIRTVRQIEFLRANYGINLTGTRMIIELLNEVERLREEMRALRS